MRINGEVRQDSTTANMVFPVAQLISVLSMGMTLEPGDLLATGTPEGVAMGMTPPKWLQPGDVMEAEVEGIGVLRNRVVAPRGLAGLPEDGTPAAYRGPPEIYVFPACTTRGTPRINSGRPPKKSGWASEVLS